MRAFYAGHYSANLMRGAVVAREPIQDLEALVRAKFGAVPNADLPPALFAGVLLAQAVHLTSSRQPQTLAHGRQS